MEVTTFAGDRGTMKATKRSRQRSEPVSQQRLETSPPSLPVRVLFFGRDRSSAVTRFVIARINRTLHRFHDRIANVVVRIQDINGHRGGCDQKCSFELSLVNGQRLYLSDLAETPRRGISRLLHRTRRLLQERRNHRHR